MCRITMVLDSSTSGKNHDRHPDRFRNQVYINLEAQTSSLNELVFRVRKNRMKQ